MCRPKNSASVANVLLACMATDKKNCIIPKIECSYPYTVIIVPKIELWVLRVLYFGASNYIHYIFRKTHGFSGFPYKLEQVRHSCPTEKRPFFPAYMIGVCEYVTCATVLIIAVWLPSIN